MGDEIDVRDEGFTTLSEGVDPVVDLVFVHGIQGHPENTWTYDENGKESGRPARRLGKLFSRKKQSQDVGNNNTSHLFWPKDFLAEDFPNARVLTYGYDSQVTKFFKGPANQSGILAHGESLMRALEIQRRGCRQRRIIFLVHSLGGIILKQALFRSKNAMEEDQDLRDIYQSTYAIIFFGTPHRGSSYAQMGVLARDIALAAGFDARDTLLRSLKPDAEMLSLLRQEFARMLHDRAFKIYSFQEGQGFKGTASLSRKIVDDDSSRLDDAREGSDFINANHMMMCRFRDRNDEGYNKVKGVVSKYVDEILTQISKDLERADQEQRLLAQKAAKEQARLDQERELLIKDIRKSLRTAHMNERVGEVTTAHTHTFDWVFTNPKTGFMDWLHSNKSLFWITGKPGSGKSTLMKYLLKDSRTRQAISKQGRPILSTPAFFFHARGVETEKSFDGLLRSIIFQLLSDVPELVNSVAGIYKEYSDEGLVCPWTIPQLEKALDNIRQQQIEGCICMFIDALDEYSGRSEDIARFVKRLAAPMNTSNDQKLIIRVCASSRPWTAFTSLLNETPSFTIQNWTKEDIRKFVTDRLQDCNRDNTSIIVDEITSRAEGVFLWVALVLDELWQPLCDGRPIENVRSLLSGLPTDLPLFYKRMIETIPKEDQPIFINLLELVLCSEYREIKFPIFCLAVDLFQRNPLAAEEIGFKPADDDRRRRNVERRIRACSSGLLEVVGSLDGFRVQFVHQTVKSFIGDAQNSSILSGKSTRDMAIAGIERLMRLAITLVVHMDSTRNWDLLRNWGYFLAKPSCPKNFPHFDARIIAEFIIWAVVGDCVLEKANSTIMHNFHTTVRTQCGENWLDTWWSTTPHQRSILKPGHNWVRGSLKPSSLLEFAMQVDLYTFSKSEISHEISRNPKIPRSPKLLYYLLIGNACSGWDIDPFLNQNPRKCQNLARFLLQNGFDPNIALEIDVRPERGQFMDFYKYNDIVGDEIREEDTSGSGSGSRNEDENEDEEDGRNREAGENEDGSGDEDDSSKEDNEEDLRSITIMHFALAIACSSDLRKKNLNPHLEILAILVEGGSNANVLNYRNYWSYQKGDATERSALHYLLSYPYGGAKPFHHPDPEVNRTLSHCITTFLNHGADPNAVDSNGVSILELALPICPYDLVELMLEKGGQVTPRLLSKSGVPLNYADGILNESRWRRPECYTPKARNIARRHNPDWADLEEEKQDSEQEQVVWQGTGNVLGAFGGYFANMAKSVKRRL